MPKHSEQVARLHAEAPLTDVHIHPSLKAYLFRRNLWRHYWSGKKFDPFSSRSDFKMLEAGGVGVIWAAHHLPELDLFRQCYWMKLAGWLMLPVYRKMVTGSRMDRVLEMIGSLEEEIHRKPERIELARNVADVRRIRSEKKIAVVHAIEGAHVLEGNVDNLDRLADRGVAMLTLTHFFDHNVAAQVVSLPDSYFVNKICRFDFSWRHPEALTDYGKEVVRRAGQLKILVDVTHCTLEARQAVYVEIGRTRPIIASHVGVQHINPDVYNLRDEEIQEIAAGGGLIGVIFFNYWLDPRDPKKGLDPIWKTIEHIHSVTGSFDHIALGTDFDGFTDPPDDVEDSSEMGVVTQMLLDRGVPEADLLKILGGNAQRVLEVGWR
jgi:membrane dipeptidase